MGICKNIRVGLLLLAGLVLARDLSAQELSSKLFSRIRSDNRFTRINKIQFSKDRLHGWLCGDNGMIRFTIDGGKSWQAAENNPIENWLSSVYFLPDDKTGWLVGNSGVIAKSADGGNTWNTINGEYINFEEFRDVAFDMSGNYGVISGDNGTIYQTYDAGRNWTPYAYKWKSGLAKVIFPDSNTGYILGKDFTLLRGVNRSGKWDWSKDLIDSVLVPTFNSDNTNSLDVDGNRIVLAGTKGWFFLSTDKGATWKEFKVPDVYFDFNDVKIRNDSIWLVGESNKVVIYSHGKFTYEELDKDVTKALSINLTADSNFYLVANSGKVFYRRNGTWRSDDEYPRSDYLTGVLQDSVIAFFSKTGMMTTCTKDSLHLLHREKITDSSVSAVYSNRDGKHIWLGGPNGVLLYSGDGGKVFNRFQGKFTNRRITSIYFNPAGDEGVIIGDSGLNMKYAGGKFSNLNLPLADTTVQLNKVYINEKKKKGWILGHSSVLFELEDGNWVKRDFDKNYDLERIYYDKYHDTYFLVAWLRRVRGKLSSNFRKGFIYKSEKGGPWIKLQVNNNYKTDFMDMAITPDELLVFTDDGEDFESIDQGNTWFKVTPALYYGSINHSLVVDESIVICGNNGFLYKIDATPANMAVDGFLVTRKDADGLYYPSIQLKNVADSSGVIIEIEGETLGLKGKRIFTLKEINNIEGWDDEQINNNSQNAFRITVSNGLNTIRTTKFVFIGKTIFRRGFEFLYWDRLGSALFSDDLSKAITRNIGFLTVLYVIVILVLYFFSPMTFINWHEAVAHSRLPFPKFLSKFLVLFLIETDHVLDAFVLRYYDRFVDQFENNNEVKERNQWTAVPMIVNSKEYIQYIGEGKTQYVPVLNEIKEELNERVILCIEGQGGIGKSSLAFQMGRWAYSKNPKKSLLGKPALPLLINKVDASLDELCIKRIEYLIDAESISPSLVNALLRKKKIIAIIDGLSEMQECKDEYVSPEKGAKFLRAVVYTSRKPVNMINKTLIVPLGLRIEFLDTLIDSFTTIYVGAYRFGEQREILRSRIRSIIYEVTKGDSSIPVPLLLLRLLIEKAALVMDNDTLLVNQLPNTVFDIFDDYINSCLRKFEVGYKYEEALRVCGTISIGLDDLIYQRKNSADGYGNDKMYVPGWKPLKKYLQYLDNELIQNLSLSGILIQSRISGIWDVKFTYDLLAEYFAVKEILMLYKLGSMSLAEFDKIVNGFIAKNKGAEIILKEMSVKLNIAAPSTTFHQ